MSELCPWESPQYLIFSSNAPTLLYYSHFFAILAALSLGYILFSKIKESLEVKILIHIIALFILWSLIDMLLWASNEPGLVLFYWSLQILIEMFLYTFAFRLMYVFTHKTDVSFKLKSFVTLLLLPIILLLPTNHLLPGIDVSYCNAIESAFVIWYTYTFQTIVAATVFFISVQGVKKYSLRKREIYLFTAGIITFLLAFSSGNLIGSITENWSLAQIGLFGMPVFIGFLSYLIIKFRTFNMKVLGSKLLVFALWLLIGSLLFIRTIEVARIIISLTLIFLLLLGNQLIKSVQREIEQRERIEKLAEELSRANDRLKELDQLKSEFLSFATHQIRSPLTAIRGYAAMIDEGDFGKTTKKIGDAVGVIKKSAESLIVIVNEFLDISRIEQGRMKYNMETFDITELVTEVSTELLPNITEKGLTLNSQIGSGQHMVHGDKGKLKQIIGNLIDNAIKYTPQGAISVSLSKVGDSVSISITDSGVGIKPEEITKLFSKFGRTTDAFKTNVTGTGLGLYVAKQMLKEHKGEISVSSPGVGKGSTFTVTLPLVSKK